MSVPKETTLARDLRNGLPQKYLEMKTAGASPDDLQDFLKEHSQCHAQALGDLELGEICCGQSAALITSVVSAVEVIEGIAITMRSELTGSNTD